MDREYESLEHPMYVLSIEAVLALGRFPSHEEALAQGLLVQWVKGMVTIFVSHTWLSKGHPDNEANEKLLLLKAFLRGAGTRDIHADYTVETMMGTELRIPAKRAAEIAYVFFDYCSVPRVPGPNRFAAIRSIPAYVTNASFVACVAGSWVHAESGAPHDLAAWATRGWCRLEVLCNGLSPIAKPLIVVQSSSAIRTYPSLGLATSLWTHSTVGTGTFTVEDDRIKLGQVMERRIDDTIKRRADEGTEEGQRWSRFLHAIKRRLLAGTGIDVPLIPKDLWLPELSFSSPTKVDSFGWAPLTYAVIEGRVDVAAALLDAGACIESPLQKNYYPLYALKGLTNLLYAAWFDGNGPMIRLLLSRGADPMRQCGPVKHSALHWACVFGSAGNAEALIEAEPRLLDLRLNLGTMPLTFIALGTQYAHLEWALKHHPGHCTDVMTGLPWGWLELACTDQAGNSDIIGLLIKQEGIDVNYYEPAKMNKVFAFITAVSKLALRLQDNPLQTFQLFAVGAATALHVAAFNGSLGSVELLLQAKANVASAAHPLKMTPLHVAAFAGHREMCVRLLEAGAPIAARDSRRRTAAMWAKRRGHESVELAISLHASAARAAAD